MFTGPHENKTNNYVYRITHIPSGRFYIGIRSTHKDPESDLYMGSGNIIKRLIARYPITEFKKEVLHNYHTRKEASEKESELVTYELIDNPLCINLKLGGDNSIIPNQFKAVLSRGFYKRPDSSIGMKILWADPEFKALQSQKIKENHNKLKHPFMVSNGYWFVWKDAISIYEYWVKMGGVSNPVGMPKRGCGYKNIGKWYSKLNHIDYIMAGDESVFRNMVGMFKDGWIPQKDKIFMSMLNSSVQSGLVVVRGTSGTGKGTRVVQFLEFLLSKQYEQQEIEFEFDGKKISVGKYFPQIELIFIGKYTASNKSGLASWTSMDFIHSTLKSSGNANVMMKHLKNKFPKATFIIEGEAMMLSNRWRPEFIIGDLGFKDIVLISFNYTTREEYDARIIGRSGKTAKEAGWSRNESYVKELDKNFEEFSKMGYQVQPDSCHEFFIKPAGNDNGVASVGYNIAYNYNAPLDAIGVRMIEIFGFGLDKQEFQQFCKTNPMLRSVDGLNPLAHRVPEKPSKSVKVKPVETPKVVSTNLLSIMRGGK